MGHAYDDDLDPGRHEWSWQWLGPALDSLLPSDAAVAVEAAEAPPRSVAVAVRCTNTSDCRPEIQQALDSGAQEVVLPTRPGETATTYAIREPGLWPRSDTTLRFEPGVTLLAVRGAFIAPDGGVPRPNALSMIVLQVRRTVVAGIWVAFSQECLQ